MHILYLIDSLAPGGAERSLASLAPAFRERGVRLDVAYLKERPGVQAELEAAGATLYCLAGRGGRLGSIRRTIKLMDQLRPDLVHTTLFESDIAGRVGASRLGVPCVSSFVNETYGPEQFSDPNLRSWKLKGSQVLDSFTARSVTRFHAITNHVADVMADRLNVPRDRIDVVPRGRDPVVLGSRTSERARRVRSSLGLRPETPLALAAARHEYQKGLDILLDAWPMVLRELPHARLLIAGREGNQTAHLRSLAEQLRLEDSVTFLGVRGDVPDLLAAADAFVFPSRFEGLGSVLLEVMALEAPIVASDLPAIRETVVGEDRAVLVPPERPDALARGIVATLAGSTAAARRAKMARATFLDRYTTDRVAEQMMACYGRTLASLSPERRRASLVN